MRAAIVLVCACTAASPDPGYDAFVQIPGAQFRPGPFPAATGGPTALSVVTTHPSVVIGRVHEKVHGILGTGARAAIVGAHGTDGSWIVPAGPPDIDTPGFPTITSLFGLARDATPGPFALEVAATDPDGNIGEATELVLVADAEPVPDGELVVALSWDGAADLDLHVIDPTGSEVWSGSPNTWKPPPPGEPIDPDAFLTGGILDHDGNADCHRDGAPSEHVIWKQRMDSMQKVIDPIIPGGDYIVRVDTRSLCGDAGADWYVAAYRSGELLGAARGISTLDDVQLPSHGAGAGVTALTFMQ
jgi:hypothetical protein